jgi:hypothetical protein
MPTIIYGFCIYMKSIDCSEWGKKTGEMKKAPCDTKYMRKKTEHFLKSKS